MTHPILAPQTWTGTAEDTPVATVTVQELAHLTGVTRERLRTWERRHGFPVPARSAHGNRRYVEADVRRVIAVRQLSASGVPLADAIEAVRSGQHDATPTLESLGATLDAAGAPAIAITGPAPLEVVWMNAEARACTDGQAPSLDRDHLPLLGRPATEALQQLLAGDEDAAVVLPHADWSDPSGPPVASVVWRVSSVRTDQPVIVMMRLPGIAAEPVADINATIAGNAAGDSRCAAAVGAARTAVGEHTGLAGVQRALRVLTSGLGGVDAFLAMRQGTQLRCATSVRGAVGPAVRTTADHPVIGRALADGEVQLLSASSARALGLPLGTVGLVLPLSAAGTPVGAAILAFTVRPDLGDVAAEMLAGFGTFVATTIQRDRAAAQLAHARRLHDGSVANAA